MAKQERTTNPPAATRHARLGPSKVVIWTSLWAPIATATLALGSALAEWSHFPFAAPIAVVASACGLLGIWAATLTTSWLSYLVIVALGEVEEAGAPDGPPFW